MEVTEKAAEPKTAAVADLIRRHIEAEGISIRKCGMQMGYSEAAVSRYLSGQYAGDTAALERAARDMLAAAERRRRWTAAYFETACARTVRTVLDLVRESSDVGLVHGPAGIGKTTAARKYAADNPTAIFWTASEGQGHRRGALGAVAAALGPRGADGRGVSLQRFCESRLEGSGRLVIIDNAQRLTLSGLRWVFDFHDATGVSFALVGNPEVLDRLGGSDQMLSRIGIKRDVSALLRGRWLDSAADRLTDALWPEAAAALRPLAREAARRPGHLRTLGKQLRIAARLTEAAEFRGQPDRAFAEARWLIGADGDE